MAKAAASKFSVLKIEDDSEDEFTEVMRGTASNQNKTQAAKKKAKKRVKKAPKVEATEEEWAKLDAKLTKLQYEEEVKKALLASQETFEEEKMLRSALNDENAEFTSVKADKKKKRNISLNEVQSNGDLSRSPPSSSSHGFYDAGGEAQRIVDEERLREEVAKRSKAFDKNGRKIVKESKKQEELESKKKSKEKEHSDSTIHQLELERDTYKAEAEKYKERYKKLCVLLKDAEVKEKAQLLVDVEKGKNLQEELAEEITELNGHLEQAKSRIHELEAMVAKKA